MDCPKCYGTGEWEGINYSDEEQHSKEDQHAGTNRDRTSLPYTCPICGAAGIWKNRFNFHSQG